MSIDELHLFVQKYNTLINKFMNVIWIHSYANLSQYIASMQFDWLSFMNTSQRDITQCNLCHDLSINMYVYIENYTSFRFLCEILVQRVGFGGPIMLLFLHYSMLQCSWNKLHKSWIRLVLYLLYVHSAIWLSHLLHRSLL